MLNIQRTSADQDVDVGQGGSTTNASNQPDRIEALRTIEAAAEKVLLFREDMKPMKDKSGVLTTTSVPAEAMALSELVQTNEFIVRHSLAPEGCKLTSTTEI